MSGRVAVLGWGATRLLMLLMLVGYEAAHGVGSDVTYFARSLSHVPQAGLGHTLAEYPLPAVGLLAVPLLLAALAGHVGLYPVMFVVCLLAADAGFLASVFRTAVAQRRTPPVLAWLLAGPLLGGIVLARFDLVVAVLAGVGVLVAARHPRWAAGAVAVATALKLWPVLLVPAFLAAARRRLATLLVVVGVGLGLAVACLVAAGPSRLLSPLTYQADRGLQVESLLATPVMAAWALAGRPWHVHYATSRSFEVTGPGTGPLATLSTALGLLLVLAVAWLWWRAVRRTARASSEGLVWLCLAAVTAFIVSAKVLSPQYLLWLFPIAVAGLVVAPSGRLRTWTTWLGAVSLLTHVLYPWVYPGLVRHLTETAVAVPLLAARNVGLLLLLVLAFRNAWQATAPTPPAPEPSGAARPSEPAEG